MTFTTAEIPALVLDDASRTATRRRHGPLTPRTMGDAVALTMTLRLWFGSDAARPAMDESFRLPSPSRED